MKLMNKSFLIPLALGISMSCFSQVLVPMTASAWNVKSEGFRFEDYLGEKSIYLPDGFAHLDGVNFHNGIIEFDIAFPVSRGFPGVYFRMQDEQNAEDFYVRPHQSGNPDANQYTPVFNGLAGWQLYYGEGHGAPVEYKYDEWNHVKLVVKGTVGEVFINDMEQPLFQFSELKHGDISGGLALKGSAQAHFANFTYALIENPTLILPIKELPEAEERVVQKFQISNAVKDSDVIAKPAIELNNFKDLTWNELMAEYTGTINIARVATREKGKNTALVRFIIHSEKEQVKRLEFGYSDIAQVFVNGRAVYLGNNSYMSRDYRYLGTIGYFDAVFLNLKRGDNEIVFSVTEAFGGWGMKAQMEDLEGITIK
jgi:hypothetical protein